MKINAQKWLKSFALAAAMLMVFALPCFASYGEQEVHQLLIDRPELTFFVKERNPIWKWLVGAFVESNDGYKIIWDKSPSSDFNPFGGECAFGFDPDVCRIRVDETYKQGQYAGLKRTSDEILFTVIFELCNAQTISRQVELAAKAFAGNLTKHDYVVAIAHEEYLAEIAAKSFKEDVLIPYCEAEHISYGGSAVWPYIPSDFNKWIKAYPQDSYYPWKLYGARYDSITKLRKTR